MAAVGYLAAEAEGRDAETSVSEEPLLIRLSVNKGNVGIACSDDQILQTQHQIAAEDRRGFTCRNFN